jgi:hypothetical protein
MRAYYYATLEYYHNQKVRTSISCADFLTFCFKFSDLNINRI